MAGVNTFNLENKWHTIESSRRLVNSKSEGNSTIGAKRWISVRKLQNLNDRRSVEKEE
jgi:hypothetical protein